MNEPNDLDIGESMRRLRKANHISLRAMAQISGFNDSYWCMLENGQRRWSPRLKEIYRETIARIVGRDQLHEAHESVTV